MDVTCISRALRLFVEVIGFAISSDLLRFISYPWDPFDRTPFISLSGALLTFHTTFLSSGLDAFTKES
jgi:hypothetical protein